jgi:hypothetical protein
MMMRRLEISPLVIKRKQKIRYVDQRTLFVDSLYAHLKKEAEKVKIEYNKFASTAREYIESGLSESEAVELLVVDGLDRDAALGYISMAKEMGGSEDGEDKEFSFVFEDIYGNVFSSHDINRTITASSNKEAFQIACSLIGDDNDYEIQSILSVERV